MPSITTTRSINAPVDTVFRTIAHIEEFSRVVPEITNIEFLTEQRTGVGTRFKETRRMGKREGTVELEVREYEPNQHVRIVSDAGGTVWDTLFETRTTGGSSTELRMTMEARAYKLMGKLMNPVIMGVVRKHVEKDMDAVKAHCESA